MTEKAVHLDVVAMPLDGLVMDSENPRSHDSRNMESIRHSLREHGQVEPLVVQKSTHMVIAGNGRMQAMRDLGWTDAQVVLLNVDNTQARKLSIALNRSGELAGWDEAVLTQHLRELSDLADWDPEDLGFSAEEIDALVATYGDLDVSSFDNPEPGTDGGVPGGGLPPGVSPSPMPNSGVRMVQLYLDEQSIEAFQMAVRQLAQEWGTDNITDTVHRAVLAQAEQAVPVEA